MSDGRRNASQPLARPDGMVGRGEQRTITSRVTVGPQRDRVAFEALVVEPPREATRLLVTAAVRTVEATGAEAAAVDVEPGPDDIRGTDGSCDVPQIDLVRGRDEHHPMPLVDVPSQPGERVGPEPVGGINVPFEVEATPETTMLLANGIDTNAEVGLSTTEDPFVTDEVLRARVRFGDQELVCTAASPMDGRLTVRISLAMLDEARARGAAT